MTETQSEEVMNEVHHDEVSLPVAPEKVDLKMIENIPPPPPVRDDEPPAADAEPPVVEPENIVVPMSRDERKKQRNLVRKIQRYYQVYPKQLGKLDADLYESSLEELEDHLDDVKFNISATNSEGSFKHMYHTGMLLVEGMGTKAGLKLQGLSQATRTSKDVDDILTETALEYSDYLYVDPLYRLAFTTVLIAGGIHQLNMKKTVPPEVEAKFKDL